jgi:hypothetical protein
MKITTSLASLALAAPAFDDPAELAQQLSNPGADLYSVPIHINVDALVHGQKKTSLKA